MNAIQYRKAPNEKQFPGCLGRVVNLFDLGNSVTGNKLLTDKPHNDGSSLPRSCSDLASMLNSHFGDEIVDKMTVSELRRSSSNKKANGTPMKTLLAQEMSKEFESRRSPPNVVAKLMGLDTLPYQQHSAPERSHSKGYSRRSLSQSGMLLECWEQDNSVLEKRMQSDGCLCDKQNDYRDVHEIWQQSEKANLRDNSPQKGRHDERSESANERKMALVRQKFIEAKQLAMDEKSRQSKEFQDALEVLSSNRDLFLKFLQEPHSLFSQHLYDMQSIPLPPETKRITVLRPSKAIDNEKFVGSWKTSDKQSRRQAQIGNATAWDKNNSGYSPTFPNLGFEEYSAPPTRIVVLKPSPGKTRDKEVVAPPSSSPTILQGEEFCYGPEDEEELESREVAKEITGKMHTMGHRRDETPVSSVFSNGYIGDDSSFNKSDIEYAEGNLTDSEIMSPLSRHSWDYINRNSSPFSSSSFSRASCSPESSVCREAKKRLSERWAMMASNGNISEQKNARRSSSTLGEMLALSDTKRTVQSEEKATDKEQEQRGSTYAIRNSSVEEGGVGSPKSLLRSRSLPVSSMVYGTGLNVDVSESEAGKTEISKEPKKTKTTKSSLKGKVSSLFFPRSKKSNKEKSGVSHSKDESQSATSEIPGLPIPFPRKSDDNASLCVNNSDLEDCSSLVLSKPSCNNVPNSVGAASNQVLVSEERVMPMSKSVMVGNIGENQDQPSPISVLEPPFEEDDSTVPELPAKINLRGAAELPPKSNLIDKSPPIESIARTLSWGDSCVDTATPSYTLKPSSSPSCTDDEQDWPVLIQTLLSEAGLDGNTRLDSFSGRWHSSESPLDPTLRSKYANENEKVVLHEAKQRQRRSNRKLVFDCVNAALKEGRRAMLVEHVWGQMKEWAFSSFEDNGDRSRLVVERLVMKEVVGKGWSDNMRLEFDNFGKEIGDKLLAELVEDAIFHFTTCA